MKTDPIFQEKYQELQLQMAMHLLSQKELEEAEEEISKLNGQPEFAPTPQEEEWIMGIIDQELKQQKRKERWKKASRILQKVSVLLLILLIGLCTTVITVEAVRIPFIDWLMSFQEDSMSVNFHTETDMPDLEFRYLPEGYEASLVFESSQSCHYSIEDTSGHSLFLMVNSLESGVNVDMEGVEAREILINDQKAMSIKKEDTSVLVWTDGSYSFIFDGNIPLDELISVAEGIQLG